MSGLSKLPWYIKLRNAIGTIINPSTEDKQDDIISKLQSILATQDYRLELAKGNIVGHSYVNVYGENPDIDTGTDPEDIWCYGGTYNFSTTADISQLSSSSASDTQEITVVGLDSNWEEVIQTVNLTGQTGVSLGTSLIRVNQMFNSDSTDLVGDVYITTTGAVLAIGVPTTASTVRGKIVIRNNTMCNAIYSVPANKTGYVTKGYIAYGKSSSTAARITLSTRLFNGVFMVGSVIALQGAGSSTWQYEFSVPIRVPEKTDIKITVAEVEANGTDVSGSFGVILVDN